MGNCDEYKGDWRLRHSKHEEYKYSFHGQTGVEAHNCNERPLGTCVARKIRERQGEDLETDEETIFFKCLARHSDWCRCNQKRNRSRILNGKNTLF